MISVVAGEKSKTAEEKMTGVKTGQAGWKFHAFLSQNAMTYGLLLLRTRFGTHLGRDQGPELALFSKYEKFSAMRKNGQK